MNSLFSIYRFIFRNRFRLIIYPIIVAAIIGVIVKAQPNRYEAKTSIYTGVVSGVGLNPDETKTDWNTANNATDNIINLIMSQSTLKNVSMRLYAQHMMYGDPNKDNQYINARNARAILKKTPAEVAKLIDKTSEDSTVKNLYKYEKANNQNFVYGLFNWTHPHYSYEALSKITVRKLGNSDMLEIKYSADDPGIAYNTLLILNDEFVKQYDTLRFGETNNVIKFFEDQLDTISRILRTSEDSLTIYSVDNKVINYNEQTKYIAAMSRDFELKYEDILLAYNSSLSTLNALEKRISEHVAGLKNNALFVNKLKNISELSAKIASKEVFQPDSTDNIIPGLENLKRQQLEAEDDLKTITQNMVTTMQTKEGLSSATVVEQWLQETIRNEKSKAELKVMNGRKVELDKQYDLYSPIGPILKRKEREISFNENSYLSILNSLNQARMRQKNMQMTSATIKIINPPTLPISSMPNKRKITTVMGALGTFIFVLGILIIIELLDRTLRDKERTERMTSGKVLGIFPAKSKFRYRPYNKRCEEIATKYMSNALLSYIKRDRLNIVNMISTESGDGKSMLIENLTEYWKSIGLNVKVLTAGVDFNTDSRDYLLVGSIKDIYEPKGDDIIIVEYPALSKSSIPEVLLKEATINLVVARADRTWKDTDQIHYDKVINCAGSAPTFFYLTNASRIIAESFLGLLPPYSFLRKVSYQIYQLGLTSFEKR